MSISSANYLIVHGAWQDSRPWAQVVALLEKQGHHVHAIDLPGHGSNRNDDFTSMHLSNYVDCLITHVRSCVDGRPLILVGHSMAGLVISQAVNELEIDKLVYVAAYLPSDGENLIALARRSNIPGLGNNMVFKQDTKRVELKPDNLQELFYYGCDEDVVVSAMAQLQDEPLQPFFDKVVIDVKRFNVVKKEYIYCALDNTLCPQAQLWMAKRANCQIRTLQSGHSPYLSNPVELVQAITA